MNLRHSNDSETFDSKYSSSRFMVVRTVVEYVSCEFLTYYGIAKDDRNLTYLAECISESLRLTLLRT